MRTRLQPQSQKPATAVLSFSHGISSSPSHPKAAAPPHLTGFVSVAVGRRAVLLYPRLFDDFQQRSAGSRDVLHLHQSHGTRNNVVSILCHLTPPNHKITQTSPIWVFRYIAGYNSVQLGTTLATDPASQPPTNKDAPARTPPRASLFGRRALARPLPPRAKVEKDTC